MDHSFFTPDSLDFFRELKENNNKEWFQAQKERLENSILCPARELVQGVGELLSSYCPNLVADPRIDRSIYRLNQDLRFGHHKNPYKEHLSLLWWYDSPYGRIKSPSFYFQLCDESWMWAIGCYSFSDETLNNYRKCLTVPEQGTIFENLTHELLGQGLSVNLPHLKKPPKGFEAGDLNFWLRFKGLVFWEDNYDFSEDLFDERAAGFLASKFVSGLDFYNWLVELFK